MARFVILRNAMSPVGGFEAAQAEFFTKCEADGMRVRTTEEARTLLTA